MLGIVSIVFLNVFAEASGWRLEALEKCIRGLRALSASRGAATSDRIPHVVLRELSPSTLLDPVKSVVGTTDHV